MKKQIKLFLLYFPLFLLLHFQLHQMIVFLYLRIYQYQLVLKQHLMVLFIILAIIKLQLQVTTEHLHKSQYPVQ